jgi:hypothetical protein
MIQRTMFAPSVDVYSFAIIAWEICSGAFPFSVLFEELGRSIPLLRDAIVGGTRPDLILISASDIPSECVTLIQECWAADPVQRLSFRQILGRLVEMVPLNGQSEVSSVAMSTVYDIRQFVLTSMSSEPRTLCFLGGLCIVLTSDGLLWLFDAVNQLFVRQLRWKLAERVRAASCKRKREQQEKKSFLKTKKIGVTLNSDAFFVFGSEYLLTLNSALAARRVIGDLTCCDLVCVIGANALLVGGRNEIGVALQLFRNGVWEGKSWNLGDGKCPIIAMTSVTDKEVWCVCAADQGKSIVYSLMASNPRAARKSQLFDEKIFSISQVAWSLDEVWLCAAEKVLRVSREKLVVASVIQRGLRAVRSVVLESNCFMFGVANGCASLYNQEGKEVHRSFSGEEDSGVYRLAESSIALQVPGLPHLIVAWSEFGLCSWRLDTNGLSPKQFLKPLNKSVRSASAEKRQLLGLNGGSGGSSSSGSKDLRKSSLHMTRKALARATVTCDDTGKIISCNQGVKEVFGHDPTLLIGTSVRTLFYLPRTKERGGSVLLYSQQTPKRFSQTELWKSIMADLLKGWFSFFFPKTCFLIFYFCKFVL